jgi:hypothetical protein
MANILGYGFRDLRDQADSQITEQLIPVINTAITETVAFHNEEMDRVLSMFVRRTTEHALRYRTPADAKLQPLDEHGRARKIRVGAQYDVGFPLQAAGLAEGATDTTRKLETVQDVSDITLTMTMADKNWMLDHVLGTLFAVADWTFTDERFGALVVKPLANGDAITYLGRNGSSATADHNTGQAATIADVTNPFPGIYTRLTRPMGSNGRVISFVASNLVASIQALGSFYEPPDPNVRAAANTEELVGTLPAGTPGEVIGYSNRVWIVDWARLPDNYIVSIIEGGERPVAMREYEVASLRGFRRAGERNDYPYFETQFKRDAGFGIWNRVGADVVEIGDSSYDVPTGYEVPMP